MDRRQMFAFLGALGAGIGASSSAGSAAEHGEKKEPGGDHSPLGGLHAHFCGIHIAKRNPKIQIVTQHYCAAHGDDMFQCVLFDSTGKNAKLLGVEYIISDAKYRTLAAEEKRYWHPHTYEVLGGGLIAPGMPDEDERAFMKGILTTWGKAWHTWPDPTSAVPTGEPLLIWSLMGDGQVQESVVAARDKEFKVSTAAIRERRGRELGYQVPNVSPPKSLDQIGRQWTDSGDDKPTPRK